MFALSTSFALFAITVAHARTSLEVKVLGTPVVNDVDNFAVTTTIKNTGDETLRLFPNPQSVLSSFPDNSFSVKTADGGLTEFIGARAKYGFNADSGLVVLAPGESKNVTHDLGAAYKFATGGDYQVEASTTFYHADESGEVVSITADTHEPHNARLQGNLVSSKVAARYTGPQSFRKRASFQSCSADNTNLINEALPKTMDYLENAVTYLSGPTSSGDRYKAYFGASTSSRQAKVLSHFKNIKSTDPRKYTYDCSFDGCDSGVFAYVYPDTFGIVHLCEAFWSAPLTGTDSKAGTIIHESSHFTRNGGTDDIAYGQDACKKLASSNPDQAIMNADCHEYFAENNPALS